mmetsp:Transcript_983/g.2748  ORF Transcript_983/g.2748 Transcript_983/m.2748 type:complete len:200 (+) Transcript_983:602-1201(+)
MSHSFGRSHTGGGFGHLGTWSPQPVSASHPSFGKILKDLISWSHSSCVPAEFPGLQVFRLIFSPVQSSDLKASKHKQMSSPDPRSETPVHTDLILEWWKGKSASLYFPAPSITQPSNVMRNWHIALTAHSSFIFSGVMSMKVMRFSIPYPPTWSAFKANPCSKLRPCPVKSVQSSRPYTSKQSPNQTIGSPKLSSLSPK